MNGRLPNYPLAYSSHKDVINDHGPRSNVIHDILHTHQELTGYLDDHNRKHDAKMKAYFDKNRKTPHLQIGNIVFVKENVDSDRFKKFALNFEGPYIIVELLDHDRVQIKHLHTDKLYSHPLHMSRLKLAQRYQIELAYRNKSRQK